MTAIETDVSVLRNNQLFRFCHSQTPYARVVVISKYPGLTKCEAKNTWSEQCNHCPMDHGYK